MSEPQTLVLALGPDVQRRRVLRRPTCDRRRQCVEDYHGEPVFRSVFACTGCGSEWYREADTVVLQHVGEVGAESFQRSFVRDDRGRAVSSQEFNERVAVYLQQAQHAGTS